jgi:hypothetical protein
MPSDLLADEIARGQGLPLAKAAKRFPPYRQGKEVTLSCLVRWVTSGVITPDGSRIKLEAARCAGRWLTSERAIADFVRAQTPDLENAIPKQLPRSPSARERASRAAGQRLRQLGI